ncbi:MAG: hypothetical protein EB059_08145 [Alphaproteobacteria bacterium]|nr:hypothetical protein [Alphaproteobacteria bacterium]
MAIDNDKHNDVIEKITSKRDGLIRERLYIRKKRQELAMRDREIDREIADCRAAARVFGLNIEFPPDEREELIRMRAVEHRLLHEAVHAANNPITITHTNKIDTTISARTNHVVPVELIKAQLTTKPEMPRVQDIVLDRLKKAGDKGSKAAPIQCYIKDTYNIDIHEKTVGMTLYRLSKEGRVRRNGHFWFFVPQTADTKNPDAGASGQTLS